MTWRSMAEVGWWRPVTTAAKAFVIEAAPAAGLAGPSTVSTENCCSPLTMTGIIDARRGPWNRKPSGNPTSGLRRSPLAPGNGVSRRGRTSRYCISCPPFYASLNAGKQPRSSPPRTCRFRRKPPSYGTVARRSQAWYPSMNAVFFSDSRPQRRGEQDHVLGRAQYASYRCRDPQCGSGLGTRLRQLGHVSPGEEHGQRPAIERGRRARPRHPRWPAAQPATRHNLHPATPERKRRVSEQADTQGGPSGPEIP